MHPLKVFDIFIEPDKTINHNPCKQPRNQTDASYRHNYTISQPSGKPFLFSGVHILSISLKSFELLPWRNPRISMPVKFFMDFMTTLYSTPTTEGTYSVPLLTLFFRFELYSSSFISGKGTGYIFFDVFLVTEYGLGDLELPHNDL